MASSKSTKTVVNRKSESVKTVISREETGLKHECGVFGCVATGDWPTQIDVAQVICLGLVALQHRYCSAGYSSIQNIHMYFTEWH
jgi:amidophosphoribosyltransferase